MAFSRLTFSQCLLAKKTLPFFEIIFEIIFELELKTYLWHCNKYEGRTVVFSFLFRKKRSKRRRKKKFKKNLHDKSFFDLVIN